MAAHDHVVSKRLLACYPQALIGLEDLAHIQECTEQQGLPLRMAGARRWVWNWGLARRKEVYAATGQGLSYEQQADKLKLFKQQPETAWLNEADSQALQQALRDLDQAFFTNQPSDVRWRFLSGAPGLEPAVPRSRS